MASSRACFTARRSASCQTSTPPAPATIATAATIIATVAKISIALLMGATLFGYLIRLGLIFLAIWVVKDASWISLPALGATIIVTHLGLLFWELKYVAISLANPGLKPARS